MIFPLNVQSLPWSNISDGLVTVGTLATAVATFLLVIYAAMPWRRSQELQWGKQARFVYAKPLPTRETFSTGTHLSLTTEEVQTWRHATEILSIEDEPESDGSTTARALVEVHRITIEVHNRSEEPITDVYLSLTTTGPSSNGPGLEVVWPGEVRTIEVLTGQVPEAPPREAETQVAFTDSKGILWRRVGGRTPVVIALPKVLSRRERKEISAASEVHEIARRR